MTIQESYYWDAIAMDWHETRPHLLWRTHSDTVNISLLKRWLPHGRVAVMLKTDVFDEAFGDGLYPLLAPRAETFISMDISTSTLHLAHGRHAAMRAVGANANCLPFNNDVFDVIVSTSTLDHFPSQEAIAHSVRELHRVLRPGGRLLLTLDNLANPIIALRNVLPFKSLDRLHLVPYYVGATCGPRRLRRMVKEAGFEIAEMTSVMHCPRLLAVHAAKVLQATAAMSTQHRFLRWLMKWERLSHWPTRFLTGHFLAVHCLKPVGSGHRSTRS